MWVAKISTEIFGRIVRCGSGVCQTSGFFKPKNLSRPQFLPFVKGFFPSAATSHSRSFRSWKPKRSASAPAPAAPASPARCRRRVAARGAAGRTWRSRQWRSHIPRGVQVAGPLEDGGKWCSCSWFFVVMNHFILSFGWFLGWSQASY